MSAATTALAAIQGAREAQELLHVLRAAAAAPETLHVALQGIRAVGDGARLRAFTRELQRALQDSQRRAPDLRDVKDFGDLRARAALHGTQLYRTDPADGPVTFFSVTHGVPRMYVGLASVRDRVQDLEASLRR